MNGRGLSRLSVTIATVFALTGCIMQLDPPEVDLFVEPAYNEFDILIPYQMTGRAPFAQGRWTLSYFDGAGYTLIESREIRLPSGSAGVLSFGELFPARFELVLELLTARDGGQTAVPYLTRRREFVVDRDSPNLWDRIDIVPVNGAVGPDETVEATIVIQRLEEPNLAFESDERVLAVVGEIRPPVEGVDDLPFDEETGTAELFLWPASPPGTPYNVPVTVVVVDEAGNRSETWFETFQTP